MPTATKGIEVFEEYEHHAAEVDTEFRRAFQIYADRMQCKRGCSMCCSQMFSISLIEAAYISRSVKAMPEIERDRLRSAARDYLNAAGRMTASAEQDDGEATITPRPGLRLPCPALKDDACTIYKARPLICRKWGVPLFNPKKPTELQACELNFRAGEEIDTTGILEPQVELLEKWVELKDRARRTLHHPKRRATVAEAILNDFEATLTGSVEE